MDWETFHDEFQEKMGFFDGYGRNMDAWIDCMGDMYTNGAVACLISGHLKKQIGAPPHKLASLSLFFAVFS